MIANEKMVTSESGFSYQDILCPWKKIYPDCYGSLVWLPERGSHAIQFGEEPNCNIVVLQHCLLSAKPKENKYALCVAC